MSTAFNRRPGMMGGYTVFPPVLKILLIVNITVFVFQNFIFPAFYIGDTNLLVWFRDYFFLWPVASGHFMPWQLFTYMFIHGGFMHLFLNMFILWMFGMELENIWGSKKFLLYYLMCGVGAGFANQFIAPLFTSVGPTVGASGAIYGILAAFAYLFPNRLIYIYFLVPVKAKYVIIFYMVLDLMNIISRAETGIAHVAHLGGAIIGLLYLIGTNAKKKMLFGDYEDPRTTSRFNTDRWRSNWKSRSESQSREEVKIPETDYSEVQDSTTDYKKEIEERERKAQEKIDRILDKLSEGGYGSLSEEEKRILFQESKKLR